MRLRRQMCVCVPLRCLGFEHRNLSNLTELLSQRAARVICWFSTFTEDAGQTTDCSSWTDSRPLGVALSLEPSCRRC